ncbi:MAG: succinate dehydrogenase/fumarate reductase, cytochrome b subunit [Thiomicrorhabdus sp.]|nr:MAG: succinate dehydrogenase/fumarate reductase, cytochrome b subunit [Thiomicrorhabdus sp.]
MYSHPGNRPRFISIKEFHFPINALLSAAHRITGVVLIVSLIAYIALANLILLHPLVTLESVTSHWLVLLLHTGFWAALSYHWLSGLRHLLAEHFLEPKLYEMINSKNVSFALIAVWIFTTITVIYQVWS